jgi:flagellin
MREGLKENAVTLTVNTNSSALSVLQALNNTNEALTQAQTRIATGHDINVAADNPTVYAAAQQQKADISALGTVTDGLNRAQSISDVAVSAGQTISDLLNQMKAKALSASEPGLDSASRSAYNSDFQALLSSVQQAVSSASFGNANLLNGSTTSGIKFMSTADGTGFVTLSAQNLSIGGPNITVPANADISTLTKATAVLAELASSITNVNSAVATIGSQSDQITAHASFVTKLSDTLTIGAGNLIDTDEAAESARLTALQVQQQLGVQSLSIANQTPSIILSLLKG